MLVPGNFVIILDIFTSFCDAKVVLINAPFACPFYQVMHTVPWLNSSVTLLVSKAPLNFVCVFEWIGHSVLECKCFFVFRGA